MDSFKFFRGYTDFSYRLKIAMDEFDQTMRRINQSLDHFNLQLKGMLNENN